MKTNFFLALTTILFFFDGLGQSKILITNVHVWDGLSETRKMNLQVLVENNLIVEVGKVINTDDAEIIDGQGGTLIPGLSDAHVHLAFVDYSSKLRNDVNSAYATIVATKGAENFLRMGFTTVRDLGGPVFGLKQAIDEGVIPGPRIYPSGPFIGQTSGHADMRNANDPHPYFSKAQMHPMEVNGWYFLADGETEVLKASREALKKGASQLKVMAGGGISSTFDPLHSVQYTARELEAAVQAASDWDTYVAVHAYTSESIARALNAGVKSIDHGHLIDEETIKLLKEKNAWIIPQSFWSLMEEEELNSLPLHIRLKRKMVIEGANREMDLIKKYQVNLGFGSDAVGQLEVDDSPIKELESRLRWFSPVEVLRQATSENAKLFALSGKINPYTQGQLGVIAKGAYADILIYKDNPLEDITVISKYHQQLKFIMKDGEIIKNELTNN